MKHKVHPNIEKVSVNWKFVEEIEARKNAAKLTTTKIDYFDEKRISFDLDKVIAKSKKSNQNYEDVTPVAGAVETIKKLKKNGWYIIISTARNMRTYQHNVGLVNAKQTPIIINWLNKWGIPFDEIWVKPHVEFFVDDKAIEFLNWDKFNIDLSDKIIRNKIEEWHNGVTGTSNQELHEWLGWSWEEYKKYVEFKTIPERDLVIK